jgi:hypothetical protein
VGASVVNALSIHTKVEVHREGGLYMQEYVQGKRKAAVKQIGKSKLTGTVVTFKPDAEIFKEVSALRDKFVEYRSSYNTKGWYSLPIIGKSSKEPHAWDSYYNSSQDAVKDMQWTEIAELCPVTKQWLEQVYPSKHYARVRFMLLEKVK